MTETPPSSPLPGEAPAPTAKPSPDKAPPDTGAPRVTLAGLLVFALGFVLASAVALAVLRPDLTKRAVERLKFGTTSSGGVLLTVAPTDDGASLRVTFTNVSERPVVFMLARGEDELVFDLERDGAKVEPPPPGPHPDDAPTDNIEPIVLPPGGVVENVVPLTRVVPGPGRHRVVVERIPLNPDYLRLRSNATFVEQRLK